MYSMLNFQLIVKKQGQCIKLQVEALEDPYHYSYNTGGKRYNK